LSLLLDPFFKWDSLSVKVFYFGETMPLPLMEHTTVQFHSMQELWEFQKYAQLRCYHFDTRDCTMQAEFTEEQLWMALTKFHGRVKSRQQTASIK
jgi:hypothetical protein